MKRIMKCFFILIVIISVIQPYALAVTASNDNKIDYVDVNDDEFVSGFTNELAIPRAAVVIVQGDTTQNQSLYEARFKLENEQYITMVVGTDTDINVTLLGTSGDATDIGVLKKFPAGTSAGQYTIYYIGGKFPKGEYKAIINILNPEKQYAFFLMRTDEAYN